MSSTMDNPNLPDMERAIEYAEYVLACSDQSPATFVKPSTGSSSKSKSIHQKLIDLYIEESLKEPESEEVVYASHLLAKLAKKERLNCMVLSLYPGNEGYSIMLRSRSGVESETMKLPYEESEILEYIDAAQLPPFLLDLLEKAQMNVFYSGCVVVEVRDYRRSAMGSHDTQYVLLRPSPQSLLRDVMAMSSDGHAWTQDDLFQLESELIMATEEPICLDPSPAVMLVENALQYEEKFLNDPGIRRAVKRHSQSAVNRKHKLEQAPAPKEMRLHDFLAKKKEKTKISASTGLSKARLMIDNFKQKTVPQCTVPDNIDVKKFGKPPEVPNTDGMIFVEEHTMEREPGIERHMMAKITIYQPQLGDNYFGEFYLDHDYTPGRNGEEGRRCRFVIGSRQSVDRYLQQFKDLFTEEGKLQVKIAIQKANEPAPTVYYTQVVPQVPTATGAAPSAITINNAQALMKQVAASQQTIKAGAAGDMGTVASLAAKRNIPIQLSLSISPAAALTNTQGVIAQASGLASSVSQYIATSLPTAVMAAQRIKGPGSIAAQHRPSSSPLTTVATSLKGSTAQATLTAGTPGIIAIPKSATPTPAQTPPPSARTPTPTSAGSRRSSAAELSQQLASSTQQQKLQQQQQSLASYLQGLTSGTAVGTTESLTSSQQGGIANISISNLGNLPPNINIQGLTGIPGVNIANLSGLQQVSLAQIAVPITMLNSSLQAQSGLLAQGSSSSASSTSATLVTMVTALPASSSSSASTTTNVSAATNVAITTGQSTVLPQGSGMLSFPVGLGGLTQLMPVSTKTQSAGGIRGTTTMPFLQLQGQQGIQFLSLQQQQRGGVKGASLTAVTNSQQGKLGSSVPLSSVLTTQQMTALAVGAKPGQQLIQLASGNSALGQGPSQLPTHVAIQKGQAGGQQTLQLHSLHLKPGGATLAQAQVMAGKGKSKKRTTPTPPK